MHSHRAARIAKEFNNFSLILANPCQILPDSSNIKIANITNNSFFLYPSSFQKVSNTIKGLKDKKSKRILDIETRVLKYTNPII